MGAWQVSGHCCPEALLNCSSELSCLGLQINMEGINLSCSSHLPRREEGLEEGLGGDSTSPLPWPPLQHRPPNCHPRSSQGTHSL